MNLYLNIALSLMLNCRYCGSVEIGSDGVENGERYILVDTIDLQMPKVKIFTQRCVCFIILYLLVCLLVCNVCAKVCCRFILLMHPVPFLFPSLSPLFPSLSPLLTPRVSELSGHRIVIQVDAWPRYSKYPIGHCCRILGPIGDQKVESEAILIQHGISYEAFTPAVMRCLPNPWYACCWWW
jgi:hypothetical protein